MVGEGATHIYRQKPLTCTVDRETDADRQRDKQTDKQKNKQKL